VLLKERRQEMERKNNIKYPTLLAEMARRGETQKTIAELLGESSPTICRKFAGQINWNIREVDILCEHFDMDYYELFK
jgi:hypothetical protein